jgi:hypothetical protein
MFVNAILEQEVLVFDENIAKFLSRGYFCGSFREIGVAFGASMGGRGRVGSTV